MKKFAVLWITLIGVMFQSNAQFQGIIYNQSTSATVTKSGNPILSPFCGGFNAIQLNHSDINQDGKKDLIVFDNYSNVIKTFLNIGNAGETKYSYNPKYESNFSFIDNYLILKDYNCDGIDDLFTKDSPGVMVYKGYYQNNELKFSQYKALYYPAANGPINCYVQPTDIPSIEDVDGDGDLDVCAYEINGFYLTYYKNLRVEDNLPCDSMRMIHADKCWGKFYQGVWRTVGTNVICKGGDGQNKKYRHPKNTSLHIDIDNDGDLDLLNGNVAYSDIQLYYNNGNDVVIDQDTLYNTQGHQVKMPYWPAPSWHDIDNDGDKDLLITAHADDDQMCNYKTIQFYKNMGTASNPSYIYVPDTLLMKDIIDVGKYSYPTFFDYDKDGKKDLFIGNEGYYNNDSDTVVCKLAYFRNLSTNNNIAFEYITDDFLNLSAKNYKGIFPTFGDITGDGVDDLLFGNVKGNFVLYKNAAGSNSAPANFQFFTDSLAVPSPGAYAAPAIYDLDADGKNDLVSGNQAGRLVYYRDTSSNNVTQLKLITTTLGDVLAGKPSNLFGYSAPCFSKMDNLDTTYLIIGNVDGVIARYDSFRNNAGNFKRIDSFYNYIQTPYRSVVAVADLDNNGKYEMVIGNRLGGLLFYQQNVNVGLEEIENANINLNIYPNPTDDYMQVELDNPEKAEVRITLLNMMGQPMQQHKFSTNSYRLNVKNLSTGLYIIRCEKGNQKTIRKVVVQ